MSWSAGAAKEFAVVFLGVAVALAADSWRDNQSDERAALAYADRLVEEVQFGLSDLQVVRARIDSTQVGIRRLLLHLDGVTPLAPDSLVVVLLRSSTTGFERIQFGPDLVYQELLASGYIPLLGDPLLRGRLVDYYGRIGVIAEEGRRVVRLHDRVAGLTGYRPLLLRTGANELSRADRLRLLEWPEQDRDLARDLRLAHSGLSHMLFLMDLVEDDASVVVAGLRELS